ncbi:ATP-binding protein [Caldalkalibacillus thermarum]
MFLVGGIFLSMLESILEQQIGETALNVAKAVATMPTVIEAFKHPNPSQILQPLAEEIRQKTGASFVVIGNKDGIRYSHPIPERIGQSMVGGDNPPVLEEGKAYISKATGSLGPSIRGKVPIFDENGSIIGVVSVGFLINQIDETIHAYQKKALLFISGGLLIGIIGSSYIANGIKKSILNLEPDEIASLFQERNAILESIREGIIAINENGHITLANQAACKLIGTSSADDLIGKHIREVLPQSRLPEVLKTGKSEYDDEFIIGQEEVIVNRVPIFHGNKIVGAVSSFRKKTEIDQLTKQLSQVQAYADALRSQTHEYSNKLYTISGLIQLGSYQEAIELINKETADYQELVQFLMSAVPDTIIAAFLLGKYNRAHELKITFVLDKQSTLRDLPEHINREKLVTILGNLIDNAFEAVLENNKPEKKVTLFMTDLGHDLIFEIEDNGKGIPDPLLDSIFKKGISTKKQEGRGIGLYLVHKAVQSLNGYVTVTPGQEGGALFTVVIPKQLADQEEVDHLLGTVGKGSVSSQSEVPKGINPLTLQKVEEVIRETQTNSITAEELGQQIGVSRTTSRRYLEYLVSIGKVRADLAYGAVGRPERRYYLKSPAQKNQESLS